MISLIWTRKNNFGSKLIRKVTSSESSHFSIVFDEKIVFQSTFTSGVHLGFYNNFKEKNIFVYRLNYDLGLEAEEEIWQKCASMDGSPYDYLGAVRLGLVSLSKELSKWLPYRENRSFYCLEVARSLGLDIDLSTTTPDELYRLIYSSKL